MSCTNGSRRGRKKKGGIKKSEKRKTPEAKKRSYRLSGRKRKKKEKRGIKLGKGGNKKGRERTTFFPFFTQQGKKAPFPSWLERGRRVAKGRV